MRKSFVSFKNKTTWYLLSLALPAFPVHHWGVWWTHHRWRWRAPPGDLPEGSGRRPRWHPHQEVRPRGLLPWDGGRGVQHHVPGQVAQQAQPPLRQGPTPGPWSVWGHWWGKGGEGSKELCSCKPMLPSRNTDVDVTLTVRLFLSVLVYCPYGGTKGYSSVVCLFQTQTCVELP